MTDSEEDVKIKFLLPFLAARGYKQSSMDFNVGIEVHEGRKKKTIFADVLVYTSDARSAPLLLCETKAPSEPLNRVVREQAISYARLLPQIAPLVLITNGAQTQVFHTLDKTRLPDLPKRADLDRDLLRFVLSQDTQDALRREAKHDLFIIDDVQTFKNILKACHNEIRNNEGLDPTAAFDEMSKVMFCKLYEEKEHHQNNRFRLGVFDDTQSRLGINVIRQILTEAKNTEGYKELFAQDAEIKLKDRTIREIVRLFEDYDLSLTAFDVKGEAFEYFLGDTFTGGLGEYFTPRNVVEFMVDALDPKIGDRVIDPFCGTGGFLIYAFEIVSDKIRLQEFTESEKKRWRFELSNRCIYGTDWKERTSQACKMNMMVHGDGSSGIMMHDGFLDVAGKTGAGMFDLCITNPPFGSMETDPTVLQRFDLGQGYNSQDRVILAVERCLDLVKPGGWVGIIVIDGVLNNDSMAYVRDLIRTRAWIRGVISLNKETFEGYGSRAKTSILFLERKMTPDTGSQQPVFMAVARNTGLAPNGAVIAGNVLPDILMEFRAFRRGQELPAQYRESGVFQLRERLDAEHYVRGTARPAVEITTLHLDTKAAMDRAIKLHEQLGAVREHFAEIAASPTVLGVILEEIRLPEKVELTKTYALLGVRWWGEGAFVRERKPGRDLRAKTVFRTLAGHIIYNRLFAFRGSFAMLLPEHDGCYVSGEFPMFRSKTGIPNGGMICRYIVHALNSPQFLAIIDAESTGSTKTSRNRFNQRKFLKLVVPVPTDPTDLKQSVSLLDAATGLRREQTKVLDLAKELWGGVYRFLPGG